MRSRQGFGDITTEALQYFSHNRGNTEHLSGGCSTTTPDVDRVNTNLPGSGSSSLAGNHEGVQCRSGAGKAQPVALSTVHAARERRFEGFAAGKAVLYMDGRDSEVEEEREGLSCRDRCGIGRGRDRVYGRCEACVPRPSAIRKGDGHIGCLYK